MEHSRLDEGESERSALASQADASARARENANRQMRELRKDFEDLKADHAALSDKNSAILRSRSWRVTQPLRTANAAVHSVLRKICVRRPARLAVVLEPLAGLQLSGSGTADWIALDGDPQFRLRGAESAAGGWIELEFRLSGEAAVWASPRLFYYEGNGYSDVSSVDLPRPARASEGMVSIILPVPPSVRALRLDPTDRPGQFRIQDLRVTRLDRFTAGYRIWREVSASGALAQQAVPSDGTGQPPPLRGFRKRLMARYRTLKRPEARDYSAWIAEFEPGEQDFTLLREQHGTWASSPTISVVMPVFNAPSALLREAIESVRDQVYPHWELCIANDASTDANVRIALDEYAALDSRIKVVHRVANGHISAATNSALELTTGDFVALLDHDDRLHRTALHFVAEAIQNRPDAALIYSDEDKIDLQGERFSPYFKCDFNYTLLLSHNMISHLGAYRTDLVKRLGGFRLGYEGSQDYDLALRMLDSEGPGKIVHIPRVLYHWRATEGSTALHIDEKPYAQVAAQRAIQDHLDRLGVAAKVGSAPEAPGMNRVTYQLPAQTPSVCVVIPTRDRLDLLRVCVESLMQNTIYPNFAVCIVDNGSRDRETLAFLESVKSDRISVLRDGRDFNFSALNNVAVSQTRCEFLCMMNNDIEVIEGHWLTEMVGHAMQPGVGAVGARLWYPDGRLQHGGVILGLGGVANHVHTLLERGNAGYFGRAAVQQEFSAVTAACLVLRRSLFEEVGGFDEQLKVAFNDIDLCLRLRELGYRNVWTPYAELTHHESASRGQETTPEKLARFHSEVDFMKTRWEHVLDEDPAYSRNLSLYGSAFTLAWPPRIPFTLAV